MTGRIWRKFSVFWPFMLAGLIGRREPVQAASTTMDGIFLAPTGRAARVPASPGSGTSEHSSNDGSDEATASSRGSGPDSATDFDDGWWSVTGHDLAVAEVQGCSLPSQHLASSSAYKEHFYDMPIQ